MDCINIILVVILHYREAGLSIHRISIIFSSYDYVWVYNYFRKIQLKSHCLSSSSGGQAQKREMFFVKSTDGSEPHCVLVLWL